MIFPVPLTLKRFAAPLCVFSFISSFFFLATCDHFLRRKNRDQIRPFHFGSGFHRAKLGQFDDQPVQQRPANSLVNDFSSPEKHGSFYLVALLQEAGGMILFELIVVVIRVGPELYFLDRNVLLMLPGIVFLFVLLIEILAVVHDSAHRWACSGRDFYQIQTAFFSNLDCRLWGQNSELFVLIVNDTNFACPDSVVYPYVLIDGLDPPETAWPRQTNGNLNKRTALFSIS